MVYASAYTYRASVWFDFVVPGPDERAWLREKYPASWDEIDPVWQQITDRWRSTDRGNDFAVHGTSIVSFCDLCQLVLCGGTPATQHRRGAWSATGASTSSARRRAGGSSSASPSATRPTRAS